MDSYGLVIGHAAKYSSHDIFQPEAIVSSNYNEYDNDEFNYRKPQNSRRKTSNHSSSSSSILSIFQNQKQLGATLLGVGLIFTFLGMMLLFERNLLRLGNICLIFGIVFLIGPDRVSAFFMKESRLQASIITSLGIILVFWGKPRLGIVLEIFGLMNLFGNMFPVLLAVGKKMPIVGDVLSIFDERNPTDRRDDDYDRPRSKRQYPEF